MENLPVAARGVSQLPVIDTPVRASEDTLSFLQKELFMPTSEHMPVQLQLDTALDDQLTNPSFADLGFYQLLEHESWRGTKDAQEERIWAMLGGDISNLSVITGAMQKIVERAYLLNHTTKRTESEKTLCVPTPVGVGVTIQNDKNGYSESVLFERPLPDGPITGAYTKTNKKTTVTSRSDDITVDGDNLYNVIPSPNWDYYRYGGMQYTWLADQLEKHTEAPARLSDFYDAGLTSTEAHIAISSLGRTVHVEEYSGLGVGHVWRVSSIADQSHRVDNTTIDRSKYPEHISAQGRMLLKVREAVLCAFDATSS